jgi:hypothetical protein
MDPESTGETNQADEGQLGDRVGHETSDVSVRAVALSGVALVGVLGLVLIATAALQYVFTRRGLESRPPPPALTLPTQVTPPPEPRLQAAPAQELQKFRADEESLLNSYGWVDQNAGVVRIPITRAMDLILQRGLPTRPDDQSRQFKDEGNQNPEQSSSGRMWNQISP